MNGTDALILAAGKGTRMPSPRPKVLQTLLGETMLTLVTATLAAMPRVRNVFTLVGNEADMVSAEADRAAQRLNIRAACIRQERQLGTGHGMWSRDEDGNMIYVFHNAEYVNGRYGGRDAQVRRVHWSAEGMPLLDVETREELDPAYAEVMMEVTVA